MKGNLLFLLLAIMFAGMVSCSKDDPDRFLWNRNIAGGDGAAVYVEELSDTTLLVAGVREGHPFAAFTDEKGRTLWTYYPEDLAGSLTAGTADTTGYYFAGSLDGSPAIFRLDSAGEALWTRTLTELNDGYATALHSSGPNHYYISTGCDYDTLEVLQRDGYLLAFDTSGTVQSQIQISNGNFLSIGGMDRDAEGNYYIAVNTASNRSKTGVSLRKYSSDGIRLWDEELYNNPEFGAFAVRLHHTEGALYVNGKTELLTEGSVLQNSFLAKASASTGLSIWKVYPESSNMGTDMAVMEGGNLTLLNLNCMILNVISPEGEEIDRFRPFDVCDNYDTDAYGYALQVAGDGYFLIAGEKSGSFRLMKADYAGTTITELY